MSYADRLADERHQLHEDHPTHRPLSDGYERVGLAGEIAFSKATGMACDLERRPGGDSGRDFRIYLSHSVDVKTARKPYNLLLEKGTEKLADIYVLARYHDDGEVSFVGWEWGVKLARQPTKKFHDDGPENHYIPATELRPMDELWVRMLKL